MAAKSHNIRKKRKQKTSGISFAPGFTLPTNRQIQRALGLANSEITREYDAGGDFFQSVPRPSSVDDWLAQYKEQGQSLKTFLSTCPWLCDKIWRPELRFVRDGENMRDKYPDGKVYILPLGDFDDMSPDINELARYARLFYMLPVVVLPKVQLRLPKDKDGPVIWCGFDGDNSHDKDTADPTRRKSSRIKAKLCELQHRWQDGAVQLKVHGILKLLHNNLPEDALCLIALTMSDLYEEDPDLFVAGMASGKHAVAVFSFARYDPALEFSTEFWYEMEETGQFKEDERKSLMLQRSCKLLVHEIAHLFGIDHCIWYACCMNGSGHLQEDFTQPIHLCPVDLHKLQRLCGFDIVQRYKGLLGFFTSHGMSAEADWVSRRLQFITTDI